MFDSGKAIIHSKTFWINLITGILLLTGAIPENKYVGVTSAVLNIFLRVLTDKPIDSIK